MNLRVLNEYGRQESVDPASWIEALGVSASGMSETGVVSIVTLSLILFSFFWFSWCWWSRGQILDFSMNMGNWSNWSQNIGSQHWGYHCQVHWGQGWC